MVDHVDTFKQLGDRPSGEHPQVMTDREDIRPKTGQGEPCQETQGHVGGCGRDAPASRNRR